MSALPLVRFELRRLRWPLVAVAAWALLGPIALGSLLGHGDPRLTEATALGTAAVLLALAHALLGRPRRDDLTCALPVDPGQVHTARTGVLAAAALGIPSLQLLAATSLQALYGPWPAGLLSDVFLPQLARAGLQGLIFAGLAAGLIALGAASAWVGGLVLLLTRCLRPELDPLRLDTDPTAWVIAAAAAVWVSRLWFTRPQDLFARWGTAMHRGPLGQVLARVQGMLSTAVLVGLPLSFVHSATTPSAEFPDDVVHITTPAYRLRMPARQRRAAQGLIARAPDIHAAIASSCGVHQQVQKDRQIQIDLRDDGESSSDAGRVVDLRREPAYELARATAETLLERRLGDRRARWSRALGVIDAGLVRHLAARASALDPFGSRFHAAVLHARRRVDVEELFDRAALERWRGPEASPALGEALWAALSTKLGPAAPSRYLAAVDSIDRVLAWDEVGSPLLHRLGITRDALRLELMRVLEDDVREDPRAHVPLPRLRVLIDVQDRPLGWRILAIPDVAIPPGWKAVCRVRRTPPGAPDRKGPRALPVGRDERGVPTFFVEEPRIAGDSRAVETPWIQVGLRPLTIPLLDGGLWEDWTPPAGPP